jgi:hypothetical protein
MGNIHRVREVAAFCVVVCVGDERLKQLKTDISLVSRDWQSRQHKNIYIASIVLPLSNITSFALPRIAGFNVYICGPEILFYLETINSFRSEVLLLFALFNINHQVYISKEPNLL